MARRHCKVELLDMEIPPEGFLRRYSSIVGTEWHAAWSAKSSPAVKRSFREVQGEFLSTLGRKTAVFRLPNQNLF
jgi:hypothetical protein